MNAPLNLPRPAKADKPKLVSAKDDTPPPATINHNLSKPAVSHHVQLQVQVPPEIRRAFKAHAAERDVSMSDLFVRMWDAYKASNP